MGAVGFTYWILKGPIYGYWAVTANETDSRNFAWLVAKDAARAISTAFLMGLFLAVDVRSLAQKNREVRINHFLVPAAMSAILGAFSESLIDQYAGPLDKEVRFVPRCNHTIDNTLFFFVPVCFSLFTFLCLSFISFVHFIFFGGQNELVVFRSTQCEAVTFHFFRAFFVFFSNAILADSWKTA